MKEKQIKILRYLKDNPQATYQQIKDGLDMRSQSGVVDAIKTLMAHQYLKRINKWHLTKQATKVLGEKI